MKDLLAWALPLLHKRTNFVLASFGTAALATFFVADRFGINWYSCAVFPACLIIILFATYALLTQYPTTKKNHIGLVFAITGESQNSVEIIEADFIKPVRTELSRNALQTPFYSLTLSQTHAAKVHDVETALSACHPKRHANFRLVDRVTEVLVQGATVDHDLPLAR